MKEIVYVIFQACVHATLPNPHTINNLTQEQQAVVMQYVNDKCTFEVQAKACGEYFKRFNKTAPECVQN